jgi:hypothetical protein
MRRIAASYHADAITPWQSPFGEQPDSFWRQEPAIASSAAPSSDNRSEDSPTSKAFRLD